MLGLNSNKVPPPSSLVSDVIRQDEEYNTDLQLIGCCSMIAWYNHKAAPFLFAWLLWYMYNQIVFVLCTLLLKIAL